MQGVYRPYQLVWVSYKILDHKFSAIGEAISYPDDSNAINVRRVPGDPMTMVTVSLDALSKLDGPKPKEVEYACVGGSGTFPIDMLRFDNCVPVNFTVDENCRAILIPGNEVSEELVVAKAVTHREPWTKARWQSFLWGLRPLTRQAIIGH